MALYRDHPGGKKTDSGSDLIGALAGLAMAGLAPTIRAWLRPDKWTVDARDKPGRDGLLYDRDPA